VQLSEQQTLMASCGNDQSVIVWKTDKFVPVTTLKGHDNIVETVCFVGV